MTTELSVIRPITESTALAHVRTLVPQVESEKGAKRALRPHMMQRTVTVVGIKRTTARFLPVSHEGDSNETYVDKVDVLGTTRAEFIARKLKAIERRAHMRLFRDLTEQHAGGTWKKHFEAWFGRACEIPNSLCTLCWNDSLFGSLETDKVKGATFSRIRYFDTYSIEPAEDCIARLGSDEGMAIGNTVGEDLSKGRGDSSLHYYEYVKPDTHFPFITIIENPTLLDIAGLVNAITAADVRGYGKYSANSGKFDTDVLAVSTGVPRFSVLKMLEWAKEYDGSPDHGLHHLREQFTPDGGKARFEDNVRGEASTLWGQQSDGLWSVLGAEFVKYVAELGSSTKKA